MAYWGFANRPATEPVATNVVTTVDPTTFKTELKHAYDRGRADARPRRGGFGLLALVLFLAAAVGILFIVLAIQDGSFAAAGSAVDNTIAQMTGRTQPAPIVSTAPNPGVTPAPVSR